MKSGHFDIVKAIYFIAFLIVFSMAYLLVIFVPNLKDYRMLSAQEAQMEKQLTTLQGEIDKQEKEMKKEKDLKAHELTMLAAPFNKEAMIHLAPQGSTVTISDMKDHYEDAIFFVETYDVTMIAVSPVDFYKYAQQLALKGAIAALGPQLSLQRMQDNHVQVTFPIRVYRINPQASLHQDKTDKPQAQASPSHPQEPVSEASKTHQH